MSLPEFIPGQRWISNTEAELGLGIIVDYSARRVTIQFPAAQEERIYAAEGAPLSRVEYPIGEVIQNTQGQSMTVLDRVYKNGLWIYQGSTEQGETLIVLEAELNHAVHFSKPQDRLYTGQIDKHSQFQLRVESLNHLHKLKSSSSRGLLGPRVQLLPHQFYIAHQVSSRPSPRVLLADEVGLGKTIEAGLIMHQQRITGRAERQLVLVPDSLVHQWLVEMARRFNTLFTVLDEERCCELEQDAAEDALDAAFEALESFDDSADSDISADNASAAAESASQSNPFSSSQQIICALSLITDNPKRFEQCLAAGFDMLVVDEAHHLKWQPDQPSLAYQRVEALAAQTPSLLLLTATPEQLGLEGHFARLRLLDPHRYHSLSAFIEEEDGYHEISELVNQLSEQPESLQHPETQQRLRQLLGEHVSVLDSEPSHEASHDASNEKTDHAADTEDALTQHADQLISELLDRHGTGRVLFRNSRQAVKGFPKRQLHLHPLPAPAHYPTTAEQLADLPIESLLQSEHLPGCDDLMDDPRVEWLENWLTEHRQEKALVICHSAKTAMAVERYLRLICGIKSTLFHEGMSLVARDRAAAYFADPEDSAQVLICSEIGSEGRNFQFLNQLLMFDLPLNPDLLEQRIGRLDRIGQTDTVNIHLPHFAHSPQAVLLAWYQHGLNVFEKPNPAAMSLQQQTQDALFDCMRNPSDQRSLDALIEETQAQSAQALERLEQGRNKLLELNSCHPKKAKVVIESIAQAGGQLALASYLEKLVDVVGIELQHHGVQSIILKPSDHMHFPVPALPEDGITATLQREEALAREDMHFLSWEHPLVQSMMDIFVHSDHGTTAFGTLKHPQIAQGELILEAIFTAHCPAPKALQVERYVPHSAMRLLVDSQGRNISKGLKHAELNNMVERLPKHVARQMAKAGRTSIDKLIDHAERIAANTEQVLISRSQESSQQIMQAEITRLEQLSNVNPSIRQSELQALHEEQSALENALGQTKLQLNAVRLLLAT